MSNIIDNPKVKLKTYSFYINNKNDKRIFDYMTSISKNIGESGNLIQFVTIVFIYPLRSPS